MKNQSKNSKDFSKLSDNEIVKLVVAKNQRAYQELMKRYQMKLYSYLRRLIRNKEESEDLLQGVFMKVYRNIKSFDTRRKFSSWIYRIAHNEAVNFLKKRSKKHFVSIEDIQSVKDKLEITDTRKNPIDSWIAKELKKEMQEALEKLPPKYKEVLMLRYYYDKSYEEMSKVLRKPVNTVGTLLNRAKKKLMVIMGKRWK